MEFEVNWLAVLVGTVAHQILGALWYGVLFRDTWMKAMGTTMEEMEGASAGLGYAFGAVCSLVSVIALGMVIGLIDEATVADGVIAGAVTGIGFVAASTFMNSFYEQKKAVIGVLFGGYYTLGLMAAGAIIGAWN